MPTYTSNYGWTKPSGSDNVDISVLNNNLDDQDSTIHDAFLNMAPPFSESSTYAVDDIVLYGKGLYKCHTAVVTPGSWTGSTNWQVYKLSEGGGGGGGTSDYTDLTNKPQINGVTLSGNKSTSDLGINAAGVGLGNVPNVSTNDQEPTFTEASTRNNIASGEKLSVIMGKIQKFFNDLKTVAFSGSFSDLSNKPSINSVELSGNKTSANLSLQNASTEITWADWIQKTPQEQEAGDWRITDCPWADGDVSVDLMTKLWENPSPTSAFADQNISLSSDNYDLLLILYVWNVSGQMLSTIVKKSEKFVLSAGLPSANGARDMARYASFVSDTIIHFIDATDSVGTSSSTTNNNRCIPIIIYGIKLTATVKINAIAMDVSTSADKCMLSDGVTSVEDIVNSELFKVVNYTQSSEGAVTVPANSREVVSIDSYSPPQGYTCIGIWKFSCHKDGIYPNGIYFESNALKIALCNVTSSNITGVRPQVALTYVKTALVTAE